MREMTEESGWWIDLSSRAVLRSSITLTKTGRPQGVWPFFIFRPTPSRRLPSHLRALNNPPPPGRGGEARTVRPVCGCGFVYDLPLSPYPVPSHSLSLVRLLEIGLRVIRAVPSSFSLNRIREAGRGGRRRHPVGGVLGIPMGLRSCVPLLVRSIRQAGR